MEFLDKAKDLYDKTVKAVSKTDTEKKLAEALSKDNWGASSTLLREIAQLTFDWQEYGVVMKELWSTLDLPTKQWRQIFKGLTLLEYLIKNGTERVIEEARDHIYQVRMLTSFSHRSEGAEKGAGVREKAKQLIEMLNDNDLIREEREKARALKDKYTGIGRDGSSGMGGGGYSGSYDSGGGGRYGRDSRDTFGGFDERKPNRYSDGKDKAWDDDFDSKNRSSKYSDETGDDKSSRRKSKSKSRAADLSGSDSERDPSPAPRRTKGKKEKKKKKSSKKKAESDDFGDFAGADEEPDLFGTGAAATAGAAATEEVFDPFGNNAGSAPSNDAWSGFESAPATQAPSSEPAFGDFSGGFAAAPAPTAAAPQVDLFSAMSAPAPVQQPPANTMMGMENSLMNMSMNAPVPMNAPAAAPAVGGDPFGDFMGSSSGISPPMAAAPMGDLLGGAGPSAAAPPMSTNLMGGSVPAAGKKAAPAKSGSSLADSFLEAGIVNLDNLTMNSSSSKNSQSIGKANTASSGNVRGGGMQQPMGMMGGGMQQQPMNMMGGGMNNAMGGGMNNAMGGGMNNAMGGGMNNAMGGGMNNMGMGMQQQQPMNMMGMQQQQPMGGMQQQQQPMNMMGGGMNNMGMGMQQQQPMNMMGGMNGMQGQPQNSQTQQQNNMFAGF